MKQYKILEVLTYELGFSERERESRKLKLRAWALQPLHRLQAVFGRERKEKGLEVFGNTRHFHLDFLIDMTLLANSLSK